MKRLAIGLAISFFSIMTNSCGNNLENPEFNSISLKNNTGENMKKIVLVTDNEKRIRYNNIRDEETIKLKYKEIGENFKVELEDEKEKLYDFNLINKGVKEDIDLEINKDSEEDYKIKINK